MAMPRRPKFIDLLHKNTAQEQKDAFKEIVKKTQKELTKKSKKG